MNSPQSRGKAMHFTLAKTATYNWEKWVRSPLPVWPNVLTQARAGRYLAYRPLLNYEFRLVSDPEISPRRWLEVRYIGRPLEGHAPWDENPSSD